MFEELTFKILAKGNKRRNNEWNTVPGLRKEKNKKLKKMNVDSKKRGRNNKGDDRQEVLKQRKKNPNELKKQLVVHI